MNILKAGTQSLGTLVVNLAAETVQYEKQMRQMLDSTELTMAKIASVVQKSMKMITVAIVAASVAGVAAWARLDDMMTKSLSIMGNVAPAMRKQMELTARQMATESTTSAVGLAEAYYFLASAGLDAKQSMGALGVVNKFSIAGAFDLAMATTLLADAQSALGLASKDATKHMENMLRVSDVLTDAGNAANASIEQFSTALTTKAATAMRLLNIEIEEGMAVLAIYAEQGIKGQLAGNKFAILLRELEGAAQSNRKEWEKLGLSVYDSNGQFRRIADIIREMEERFATMTPEMRSFTFELLGFRAESLQALTPLLGLSGKLEELEARFRNVGGATDIVANRQMASFSAQMKILWNRITEVAIVIGENLAPALIAFNIFLKQAWDNSEGFRKVIANIAGFLADEFVGAVAFVADAFRGWEITFARFKVVWEGFKAGSEILFDFLKLHIDYVVKDFQFFMGIMSLGIAKLKSLFGELAIYIVQQMQIALTKIAAPLNSVIGALERLTRRKLPKIEVNIDASGLEAFSQKAKEELNKVEKEYEHLRITRNKARADVGKFIDENWRLKDSPKSIAYIKALEDLYELQLKDLPSEVLDREYTKILNALKASSEAAEAAMAEANEATKEVVETTNKAADAAKKFGDTLAESLSEGIARGNSLKDILADVLQQLKSDAIMALLMGKKGEDGTRSGGLLSGLGSVFAGVFTGAKGAGKALGGTVMPGMVYPINEQEPEFFQPHTTGDIVPLSKMKMGSGGDTYIFHTKVDASNSNDASASKLMAQLPKMIEDISLASIMKAKANRKLPA